MSRKTVQVGNLIKTINKMITDIPIGETDQEKEKYKNIRFGIANVMDRVLHDTGNYIGFNYLDTPYEEGKTDTSRVFYYTRQSLK